jgi:hypothetical protein
LTKGTPQHTQLIRDAAQRPHIRLPIITFALKNLRAHIQWSTDPGKCFKCLAAELSTQTQISDFQISAAIDENVSWLQISMHNSLLMHVRQGPSDLRNEIPNLAFRERYVFFDSFFYQQLEITLFSPFHSNEKFIQLVVDEPV